ncbi:esterase-like activity of phytase family protein [Ancylobacter sp. 6x-1]|uniref:Esterase-like activity of phytase family protein n=1 Tax=Ancylobacter crimeensis TaxID=2579147 RepID=A0ABT0DDR0_9HYPH|nr:esterase-like activity of phytase family protein [Ancylobacter crimeensis]MCK0198082.1 esterase-like activity of phytase family protein [Ancylobacter crimeensis]
MMPHTKRRRAREPGQTLPARTLPEHLPSLAAGAALLLAVLLLAVLAAPPASARASASRPAAAAVSVTATPIASFAAIEAPGRRYGRLVFLGGVALTSTDPAFGGLSSLLLDAEGQHFITLSDRGTWFAGTLRTEGERPVGMADVASGRLRDATGRTLASFGRGDTESLTRLPDGFAVGIERVQEIWRFPGPDLATARGREWPTGEALKELGSNQGIEALFAADLPELKTPVLVAIGEKDAADAGRLPGFLFARDSRALTPAGTFAITRSDGFDATDAALGPDGMVYLLERRFNWLSGVAMRLRRFPLAEVRPDARIEGEVLLTATNANAIDNMEGLAVTRSPAGAIVLTLVSDDNFNRGLQRTLLLRFAVAEDEKAAR